MKIILSLIPLIVIATACNSPAADALLQTRLYTQLPDYCPTPDAFAVAPDGSLTLSCPNYADGSKPGVLVSIAKDGTVTKLAEVPGPDGKNGRPMGIAYDPDGTLYVNTNGQLLRMTFSNGALDKTEIIATGMQGPNGLRYHKGALYVTQPKLPKFKTEKLTSGVYRFKTTDRNIKVNNDASDPNLIFTSQTQNPDKQFGLDGIVFDREGHLLVGDFGDAMIYRLVLSNDGQVINHGIYADLQTTGIDGMTFDRKGNLFVTGFSRNQLIKVDPERNVTVVVEYADNNGSNGELDQPVDLVIYDGKLIISNFDLMAEPTMVNTRHSKPYTLSCIDLEDI